MAITKTDDRQIKNVSALPGIGASANATLDTIFSLIDTQLTNATASATASVIMKRDANANTRVNNLIENLTTTATAAGTTTLLVSSTYFQQFTGSTTQTVVLPNATTLVVGQSFFISNRSTGVVTVNANGGGLIQTMAAGTQVLVTVVTVGTAAGTWDSAYSLTSAITALTGDVTASGPGSAAATIAANVVTNAKLAQMANNTVKANISGGTANASDVSAVTTATASTFMTRDGNANVKANNFIENLATTATAAGTTTLTVSSAYTQQFTGSTTQTVVLPDATTLSVGHAFMITNRSSGVVTVNANGGGLIQTMAAGSQTIVSAVTIGTAAGTWDSAYSTTSAGGGSFVSQTSATGSGVSPSGTTAQRDGSPVNGYFRYNTDITTEEVYINGAWYPLTTLKPASSATFTATGKSTWTVPAGVYSISVLVVGGGGGGGGSRSIANLGNNQAAAGGGAGGAITFVRNYQVIPGQVIQLSVGTGGNGGNGSGAASGLVGQHSYFGNLIAAGGGGGGSSDTAPTANGNAGGFGAPQAGAGVNAPFNLSNNGTSIIGIATTFAYNAGGSSDQNGDLTVNCGGGGSCNGAGGNAVINGNPGNGANGLAVNPNGTSTTYGGGGGGGTSRAAATAGTGGTGGGGNGNKTGAGGNATANTGGGGGGAGCSGVTGDSAGGNGGSGFVAVYY